MSVEHDIALVTVTKQVTFEKMYEFMGGLEGSVHSNPKLGETLGLGGAIAQGGHLVAFLNEMLCRTFRGGYGRGGEISITFIKAVRPGDTVTTGGEITAIEAEGDRQRARLDIWLENQTGEKVIVGKASALIG